MSAVLANLSMVAGLLLGIVSLLTGLLRGVPVWTALFRSLIAMSIGTLVVMVFFRSFNAVLYRFLAEKLREHREREAAALAEDKEGDA